MMTKEEKFEIQQFRHDQSVHRLMESLESPPDSDNQPRSVNHGKRSKEEIRIIKWNIQKLLYEDQPMTVRQVFYRLVSHKIIEKSEKEYKNTVVRMLADIRMRRRRPGTAPCRCNADRQKPRRSPF